MKQTKIVILGAGHVGTHCALSLMFRGLANEIVLIDTDEEKAKGLEENIVAIDGIATITNKSNKVTNSKKISRFYDEIASLLILIDYFKLDNKTNL